MKKLMITALFLTIFTGCNWVEVDDDGNIKAWWVTIEVGSGYPEGELRIQQMKEVENGFSSTNSGSWIGDGRYDGDANSLIVRIKNLKGCEGVCGFVQVYICPQEDTFCSVGEAIYDFGVVEIDSMLLTL